MQFAFFYIIILFLIIFYNSSDTLNYMYFLYELFWRIKLYIMEL